MLRHLLDRDGEIVTRADLLGQVWGYEWTGGSNMVEVVVSAAPQARARRTPARW